MVSKLGKKIVKSPDFSIAPCHLMEKKCLTIKKTQYPVIVLIYASKSLFIQIICNFNLLVISTLNLQGLPSQYPFLPSFSLADSNWIL